MLVAAPFAPLLSRYRGIFFAMLTLALSMVTYGLLMKLEALGGSDGFNIGRPTAARPEAARRPRRLHRSTAVTVVVAAVAGALARIYFDSTRGLVTLAVRENELRVEYLGGSVRQAMAINFVLAAFAGGLGGALVGACRSATSTRTSATGRPRASSSSSPSSPAGRASLAVFVASTVLEVVRSFSSSYFPNTWQLALGLFLLFVIRFLPRGIGSLWIEAARRPAMTRDSTATPQARRASASARSSPRPTSTSRIAPGERVSLIGSNGAGKTTFVNMITGYLKPDAGRIRFDGRDITALRRARSRRLGVARSFQIPQLYGDLTRARQHAGRQRLPRPAPELLAAGAPRRGDRARRRGCSSASASASTAAAASPSCPGGVRKLLDIAMALTGAPKLLLLDEPTSGVSAEEKFPMMDTIMTRARPASAMTVLFVEHDMDIVERYAEPRDRVLQPAASSPTARPTTALATDDVRRYVTGELLHGIERRCSRSNRSTSRSSRWWCCAASRSTVGRRHAWSAWSAATAPARRR